MRRTGTAAAFAAAAMALYTGLAAVQSPAPLIDGDPAETITAELVHSLELERQDYDDLLRRDARECLALYAPLDQSRRVADGGETREPEARAECLNATNAYLHCVYMRGCRPGTWARECRTESRVRVAWCE